MSRMDNPSDEQVENILVRVEDERRNGQGNVVTLPSNASRRTRRALRAVEPQQDTGTGDTAETKSAPPSGSAVLAEVEAFLTRFVVFNSAAQQVAVALWVLHTWSFESCETTPYLHVTSPEKQSGKTRLLEVLRLLTRGPLQAADMTAAALYRSITTPAPTLLFDEVQELFGRGADEGQRELRACLNSGYRLGGAAYRCVGEGAKQRVEAFPTFCPKVLAGTGELPDMLADRSIPIRLERKTREKQVERFRLRLLDKESLKLHVQLQRWADATVKGLGTAAPELPEELSDRQQECWDPLLAIADAAGGDWPERARTAAVELHNANALRAESTGTLLLKHVRDAFAVRDHDGNPVFDQAGNPMFNGRMGTSELLGRLVVNDAGPWGAWWGADVDAGKTTGPASKLASLLRPFQVESKVLRFGETTQRGYEAVSFVKVWDRYLTPGGAPQGRNTRNIPGQRPNPDVTADSSRYVQKPPLTREVTDVTSPDEGGRP
jgi:hypothetical protein